jgi:RND superfamily putative drug exporter
MVHRLFRSIGSFAVRFRWLVVAVWVLGSIASVRALPSLASQVNNDNSAFLPASAPSERATVLATPLGLSANVGQILVVADRPSASLSGADTAAVERIAASARRLPSVVSASVGEVSPKGNAVVVQVDARVSQGSIGHQTTLVHDLERAITAAAPPAGLQVHLAGSIATNVANQHQSKKTGSKVQALSILLIIVLLFIVYRSVLAPFLTLLPAALVLVVSGSFVGALASTGALQVSEVTQVLLIVLLLGAGTDYGLFLVFRVREELRNGLDQHTAVVRGVERVGESITASAGTVILALLSLLLASFGIYHDLGVPLALGIATMLLAGLTLLPALLAIFGRAAFWPTLPAPAEHRDGWWGRVARRIVARPAVALVIGLVVFGGLAGGVAGYRAAGFGGALSAPKGSDAAQGNAALAAYFPKASANPTNLVLRYPTSVWQDPTVLVTAERTLAASGLFRKLEGPLDPGAGTLTPTSMRQLHELLGDPKALPLHPTAAVSQVVPLTAYEAYRATATLVSAGGHTVQFEATLRAGAPGSTAAMDAVPAVRAALARAARASGATASGAAGEAPALYDVSSISNHDVVRIVPIAIIAIGLLLALVMRSLVAPLYLIASVALSYLAALGLAVILFVELGHSGGLTFLLPFLMFIFLLALGEDYNILMMTRIREESSHRRIQAAVARAVGATGGTITSAGLVLAGSFFVLGFSGGGGPSGSQIQDIGFGLAIGILMDTFLVRTILVPSTVALLGRWNWWPSALGRHQAALADDDATTSDPEDLVGAGRS